MRRAIVHIGTPRTGTTTLQHILTRLRPALAGAGVLYPDLTPSSATVPHLSHQYLGEALDGRRPRRDRAELLADLAAQARATPCDILLLSYEGLCQAPPALRVPHTLAALLRDAGFAMEAVMTVKPQAEYPQLPLHLAHPVPAGGPDLPRLRPRLGGRPAVGPGPHGRTLARRLRRALPPGARCGTAGIPARWWSAPWPKPACWTVWRPC